MQRPTLRYYRRGFGYGSACLLGGWALAIGGCSWLIEQEVAPLAGAADRDSPGKVWEIPDPREPAPVAASRPAAPAAPPLEALTPPYRLNTENIVQLVYHKSPVVAASREEMIAAQHGLAEFRANLSRFEPFARFEGLTSRFPEQWDSRRLAGEAVGGLEKETFDGAIIRVEGGGSGERARFGDVAQDEDEVERGSGGLMRARIEVPFVGSRKRQDRVISAAFQESQARSAVLDYLKDYLSEVSDALEYYEDALYYLSYARTYEKKLKMLECLLGDARVKPEDRQRLQATAGDTKVLLEQQFAYYRSSLLYLLEYLGITPDEAYVLEEPDRDAPSRYYEQARSPEGQQQMLTQALENNPTFRVLTDAIEDAELKRWQAIKGKYDLTAFVEGTQFAFGAETFDDRVGGWEAGGGLSCRLNDPRVLNASRQKAEAEIRQFRAKIDAEQLRVQRLIATQSNYLKSRCESRPQILENISKAQAEFEERSRIYLSGGPPALTIDDVLNTLTTWMSAELGLASNIYYAARAETWLMSATGEVYRLVGLKMVDDGNGVELPVTESAGSGPSTPGFQGHRGAESPDLRLEN